MDEDKTGQPQAADDCFDNLTDHLPPALDIPGIVYQLRVNRDGSLSFPYISAGIQKILGYTPAEVRQDPGLFLQSLMAGGPYSIERMAQTMLQATDTLSLEVKTTLKNGEARWIRNTANPAHLDNGDIIWHGVMIDVTVQKTAQEALQQSEQHYRELFDHTADAIFILDVTPAERFQLVSCNAVTREIIDQKPAAALGGYIEEYLAPELAEAFIINYQRCLHAGVTISYEEKLNTPNGLRNFFTTLAPLKNAAGRIFRIVGVAHDITERKKLEERLQVLYEKEKKEIAELQAETKARGMFIDVIAHELRTPVTPILASAGLLQEVLYGRPDNIEKRLAGNIYDSTLTLARRLEELLDLARYSRGIFKLQTVRVDFAKFLESVIAHFKPELDARGQHLMVDLPDDTRLVEIDPSRLEQTIVNLLANASKFSPEGGIIKLNAVIFESGLRIDVQDFGIGIPLEAQKRLFEPYHRVEQDRQQFHGLGLGLAISKQIVEAHGGRIWLESQPGQGSTFSFQIPLKG
jgi:PAS domain S-box-containing protein